MSADFEAAMAAKNIEFCRRVGYHPLREVLPPPVAGPQPVRTGAMAFARISAEADRLIKALDELRPEETEFDVVEANTDNLSPIRMLLDAERFLADCDLRLERAKQELASVDLR